MNEAIISGEYVTFKHVKTRKVVVLEIEVSEERFQEVISKLGMPIGGESRHVAVALLDTANVVESSRIKPEQTEGEKLRVRAVMLCEEFEFQEYSRECYFISMEDTIKLSKAKNCSIHDARCMKVIYAECGIKSRSELATNQTAQTKFKELLAKFDSWKLKNQYADNLDRI